MSICQCVQVIEAKLIFDRRIAKKESAILFLTGSAVCAIIITFGLGFSYPTVLVRDR